MPKIVKNIRRWPGCKHKVQMQLLATSSVWRKWFLYCCCCCCSFPFPPIYYTLFTFNLWSQCVLVAISIRSPHMVRCAIYDGLPISIFLIIFIVDDDERYSLRKGAANVFFLCFFCCFCCLGLTGFSWQNLCRVVNLLFAHGSWGIRRWLQKINETNGQRSGGDGGSVGSE